jgi:hypothetical protein
MIGGLLIRERDGKVHIAGVNHGVLGIVLAENDDLIVIKWPGHTSYLGRMSGNRYYSPEIYVCKKKMVKVPRADGVKPNPPEALHVEPILGWNAGRGTK